ncbi:uncharacterized protein LOC113378542 [Ctenocephalides felis]|uniref:uncharacterized protein LOC113378542 n=1 Tax=Ctenocephalides felis TaxID=7515 RepID=UPI000E6E3E66|nr:uncharacterized protein LOC113378542 [Ctenocephalides felis]
MNWKYEAFSSKSIPEMNVSRDSVFLLRFLRFKKFSLPLAQEAIERYLLLRQAFGIAFRDLDFKKPNMEELLNLGYLFPCPERDSKGRRIIVARPGVQPSSVHKRGHVQNSRNCLRNPHGGGGKSDSWICTFCRWGWEDSPDETQRGSRDQRPSFVKVRRRLRLQPDSRKDAKEGSHVHEHGRCRVRRQTSFAEGIRRHDAHGGNDRVWGNSVYFKIAIENDDVVIIVGVCKKLFKVKLEARRDLVLSNDKMAVRLDMYSAREREGAVSALKHKPGMSTTDENETMIGMSGSFRKLEVD